MAHPVQPSGQPGKIALRADTAQLVGGQNQKRTSITIINNGGDTIWLMWGTFDVVPSADDVRTIGLPILATGSVTLNATLQARIGGNNPALWGVTDSVDQTSPADTRWSENS